MARRADALVALVEDEAAARRAGGHGRAADGGVALVAGDADADHGSHRQGVQHLGIMRKLIKKEDEIMQDVRALAGLCRISRKITGSNLLVKESKKILSMHKGLLRQFFTVHTRIQIIRYRNEYYLPKHV